MLRICSRSAETSEVESSSAAINILKPEEQSAQLACQLFFADRDLSGHGTACARGLQPTRLRKKNVCDAVHDSLSRGRRKVNPLPHALPDFPEPCSGTRAVNHAPQKAQPLGGVVAVSPNVVLRDLGVQSEKGIHASGLGEDLSRVAKLRGFDDDSFLNVEDIFVAKQVHSACPACELAIEERIVVRTPADLGDIKVTGKM